MLIVPGAAGEIGVLARHAPLVAMLRAGEIRVKSAGEWQSFAAGPGYFKVQQDRALVLVDDAVRAEEIDVEEARREAEQARALLERDRRRRRGGTTAGRSSSASATRRTSSPSPAATEPSTVQIAAGPWPPRSTSAGPPRASLRCERSELRRTRLARTVPRSRRNRGETCRGAAQFVHGHRCGFPDRLLRELLAQRILVLDGAWGTMLQGAGSTDADYRGERFRDHPREVAGDPDLLNLTRPDIVLDVHRAYLDAGADITTTNTFTATSIGQADYGLEDAVYDMNVEGARLARQAATRRGRAALRRRLHRAAQPDALAVAEGRRPGLPRASRSTRCASRYAEQMRGLVDGGVDLLLIETIFDTLNAKAAIVAARDVLDERGLELPLWISVTIVDRSGRTLSGQTIEAFWASVEHARPLIVGVNCSLGAREMRPHVEELARLRRLLHELPPERGPAERLRRLRRGARRRPARCSGSSPRAGS